jgi:hypothetical protein
MTSKHLSILLLLGFVAVVPAAYAAPDDEATITVVDEDATPDDVVRVIELPDRASRSAAANSAHGTGTANNAADKSGESGREFGQQTSEDARNRDLKDQAKADARQAGKSDARNDNAGGNRHGPPQ